MHNIRTTYGDTLGDLQILRQKDNIILIFIILNLDDLILNSIQIYRWDLIDNILVFNSELNPLWLVRS